MKYRVSFPVKTSYLHTRYLHTWRDHRRYGYIINRTSESKLAWCLYNKQNITYSLMDMNFTFSCSTRYRVDHSKIKFISTRGYVISSIYLVEHKYKLLNTSGQLVEFCNLWLTRYIQRKVKLWLVNPTWKFFFLFYRQPETSVSSSKLFSSSSITISRASFWWKKSVNFGFNSNFIASVRSLYLSTWHKREPA